MAINTIAISGRLTAAPELRHTGKGTAVACGNIAVDDGYGENKKTYFFEYAAERSAFVRSSGVILSSGSFLACEMTRFSAAVRSSM